MTVALGNPGAVQTAAFVNNKPVTGKITVTKTVQYNGQTDTSFNGTFRVGISETETAAAIDSAKIQEITVTAGAGTPVEFDGLTVGSTYYIYEVDADGVPVTSAYEYTVTGSGTAKTITYADLNPATIEIINIKKTLSISVTKQWTVGGQPKTTAGSIGFALRQALKVNGAVKQDQVYTGIAGHTDGKYTVTYDSAHGTWETVTISGLPVKDTATVSDGSGGTQTIEGCDAFYYVVETQPAADTGYVLAITYSNEAQAANPSGIASSKAVNTSGSTITIINTETPGVELPSTGGPGTAAYSVSGLSLMALALWLLLRRRKERIS